MSLDVKNKPKILFGIKPTNFIHLGNLFCLKKIDLNKFDPIILVADLHAGITFSEDNKISLFSDELIKTLLAFGIKDNQIILQSSYTNIYEAFFKMLPYTNINQLNKMHLFKTKKALNLLDYTYPLLMALDILCINADYVMLGEDQKQHWEFYSYIIKKIINIKDNSFTFTKPYFSKTLFIDKEKKIKMSKSKDNGITLKDDSINLFRKINKLHTFNTPKVTLEHIYNPITDCLSIFEDEQTIYQRYKNGTNFSSEKKHLLDHCLNFSKKIAQFRTTLSNEDIINQTQYNLMRIINLL